MFKLIGLYFKHRKQIKELMPLVQLILESARDGKLTAQEKRALKGSVISKLQKLL